MKRYLISIAVSTMAVLTIMSLSSIAIASTPLNFLVGQYNEKNDPNFVDLDKAGFKTNKPNMRLQKEAAEKLFQAYTDFSQKYPNIPFVIVSATRNYDYQNGIWSRKWQSIFPKYKNSQKTATDILRFSSMPGTSRHHWGTDVDITSLNSSYFKQDPKGKILYQWLKENMPNYGFCQPYTEGRKTGYYPEEWHWSYRPIAANYINAYKEYLDNNPQDIIRLLNFSGHKNLPLETLIQQYVFSVNNSCL